MHHTDCIRILLFVNRFRRYSRCVLNFRVANITIIRFSCIETFEVNRRILTKRFELIYWKIEKIEKIAFCLHWTFLVIRNRIIVWKSAYRQWYPVPERKEKLQSGKLWATTKWKEWIYIWIQKIRKTNGYPWTWTFG